jgi:FtsH-binding integral membrane protein
MPNYELCESDKGALVDALTHVDDRSVLAVSRTRRRVYSTVVDMEEQQKGRTKQRKMAMVMFLVIITLLAPAVWTSYLNFSEGAHFADLQSQISLLAVMLFPGIAAVATATYMRHHNR